MEGIRRLVVDEPTIVTLIVPACLIDVVAALALLLLLLGWSSLPSTAPSTAGASSLRYCDCGSQLLPDVWQPLPTTEVRRRGMRWTWWPPS